MKVWELIAGGMRELNDESMGSNCRGMEELNDENIATKL